MHHEHQFKLKMAAGEKWREFNLIFTTNIGTPISHRNLLRDYKLQLKNAGVPVIRFHDLRHTAAALMLNNGVDLMVVSRRLGHARPSITLDQYGHLIPTKQAETAQLIDEIVAPISYTQLHPVAPKLHPKSKLKTRVLHQPPYTGV